MGSTYFNRKYGGAGHVWQGRYKSSLIDNAKTNPATEGLIDVDPYYLELGKSSQIF
jgi:hypothetical protein